MHGETPGPSVASNSLDQPSSFVPGGSVRVRTCGALLGGKARGDGAGHVMTPVEMCVSGGTRAKYRPSQWREELEVVGGGVGRNERRGISMGR
jgi:hypothetical protein